MSVYSCLNILRVVEGRLILCSSCLTFHRKRLLATRTAVALGIVQKSYEGLLVSKYASMLPAPTLTRFVNLDGDVEDELLEVFLKPTVITNCSGKQA